MESLRDWWRVPWRFLLEVLTGVLTFTVVAVSAVGLSFAVKDLEALHVDFIVIWGLKFVEYALFATDLILFLRFLWKTGRRTWDAL